MSLSTRCPEFLGNHDSARTAIGHQKMLSNNSRYSHTGTEIVNELVSSGLRGKLSTFIL